MSDAVLRNYLHKIEKTYQTGNATEHTYRSALEELLRAFDPTVIATNEPKRIKCGAPDFIITRKQTPLGYMEAKDIGISLDHVERTDQMKRYLGSLANLILTDYLEFRWYVAKVHRMTARLTKVGTKGKWTPDTDGIEQVSKLLQGFLITQTPTVNNPKELATRMASIAQLIRNAISLAFKSEDGGGSLHEQMEGFRLVLLPDLTSEQFADMYAQTICYGLFAARCNAKPNTPFIRDLAARDIPRTNPFLRKMFIYIAGPDLDERIAWAVDDLAEVLNRSDMQAILHDFGKRTRQEDPVVHFYETFLAEYDPKMREARGVYYTPEPVVSYIVRSVDYLLKKDFGLAEGLADHSRINMDGLDDKFNIDTRRIPHKVQVLDPATGTGTFLHGVIDHIYETFKGNKGMWSGYVSEHLLPRLFGFELLMAPYAVAHMKLGLQLAETGYDFKSNERLGVFLTNTLVEGFEGGKHLFADWLVEEATAAGNIKYDAPVMVILGNPPYSYDSENTGTWISTLNRDYYLVDGRPLGERNPKALRDDYVKFIRFAQWRIQKTGYGILAFITNHGFLDNVTLRGMRLSLMQNFDDIYVLDLHGNSKKKERPPNGEKDENVFDIQQGVAIGIFVKRQSRDFSTHEAIVHHAHLWGMREVYQEKGQGGSLTGGKYWWLATHDSTTTEWKTLKPEKPFYLFIPQETDLQAEYEQGWKVTDMLPTNSGGMNTARDSIVIDIDKQKLLSRIQMIANAGENIDQVAEMLGIKSTPWWSFKTAVKGLKATPSWQNLIISCLYRPFDQRWLFHHPSFIDRPRTEVNSHMLQHNISLVTTRQTKEPFAAIATDLICGQHKIAAVYDRSYVFPLYLYPKLNKNTLFNIDEPSNTPGGRRPNLPEAFIKVMEGKLDMSIVPDGKGDLQTTFGPEDVFDYMYAVFHSPNYRIRYAEFLRIDFPRLPLTSNTDLFRELCKLGERLVALHLMKKFGKAIPHYPEEGSNVVDKVEYSASADQPDQGRIYINKMQYFDGVPSEVWEFHVGGYQVCHKWLKDRKGRVLSFDDIKHYQRIVAALTETIELMEKIDEVIEEYGGWPIQ